MSVDGFNKADGFEVGRFREVENLSEGKHRVTLGKIRSAGGNRVFNVKMNLSDKELGRLSDPKFREKVQKHLIQVGKNIQNTLNDLRGSRAKFSTIRPRLSVGGKNQSVSEALSQALTDLRKVFKEEGTSEESFAVRQEIPFIPKTLQDELVSGESMQSSNESIQSFSGSGASGKINTKTKLNVLRNNPFKVSKENVQALPHVYFEDPNFDAKAIVQGAIERSVSEVRYNLHQGLLVPVKPKATLKGIRKLRENVDSSKNMARKMSRGEGKKALIESVKNNFQDRLETGMKKVRDDLKRIGKGNLAKGSKRAEVKDIQNIQRGLKAEQRRHEASVYAKLMKDFKRKNPSSGIARKATYQDLSPNEKEVLLKGLSDRERNVVFQIERSLGELQNMLSLLEALNDTDKDAFGKDLAEMVDGECENYESYVRGAVENSIFQKEGSSGERSEMFLERMENKTVDRQIKRFKKEYASMRRIKEEQIDNGFLMDYIKTRGVGYQEVFSSVKERFSGVGAAWQKRSLGKAVKHRRRTNEMHQSFRLKEKSPRFGFGEFFGLSPEDVLDVLNGREAGLEVNSDKLLYKVLERLESPSFTRMGQDLFEPEKKKLDGVQKKGPEMTLDLGYHNTVLADYVRDAIELIKEKYANFPIKFKGDEDQDPLELIEFLRDTGGYGEISKVAIILEVFGDRELPPDREQELEKAREKVDRSDLELRDRMIEKALTGEGPDFQGDEKILWEEIGGLAFSLEKVTLSSKDLQESFRELDEDESFSPSHTQVDNEQRNTFFPESESSDSN